jgi:hypothetical protein
MDATTHLNRKQESIMQIQVIVKNVFGNNLIYPHNDAAHVLAQIAGTKTLSLANLRAAQQLGHDVVEIAGYMLNLAA